MNLNQTSLSFVLMAAVMSPFSASSAFAQTPGAVPASTPAPGSATKSAEMPAKAAVKGNKDGAVPAAEVELTPMQMRAVSMIKEAARDAVVLEDRRTIAQIQARSASGIWKFDRESGRELFEKAFETAVTHYRESKDTGSTRHKTGFMMQRSDARQEVIRATSRYEPELAKAMTERFIEERKREMAADSPTGPAKDDRLMGKTDPAGEQLLTLASSLLSTDLEAALGLARRAVSNSIPTYAASFLKSVADIDRKAADDLYSFALNRLAAQETPVPGQLLALSAYPFGDGQVWVSDGTSTNSTGFGKPKDFVVDPAMVHKFFTLAGFLLTRTSRLDVAAYPDLLPKVNSGFFAAKVLELKVAQYEPALSEQWQTVTAALYTAATERTGVGRTVESMNRDSRPTNPADSEERIKSLLEQADKATNFAAKDERYGQAAQTARRAGDLTQALSIADKISDSEFRQSVRDWLYFEAATEALAAKKLDDAQTYAKELSVADQRSYVLFQIAKAYLAMKERARAIDLLEEAARRASTADNTAEKLRALLGIASVYGGIDPSRAFEIAGEAMKVASKVPEYGPDTTTMFRSLSRKGGGSSAYSSSSADEFDVGKTLAILAKGDVERALNLAQAIESKPLQLFTVITLSTSILETKEVAK